MMLMLLKCNHLFLKRIALLFCLCLAGCACQTLSVQTQYLTPEILASAHVGTPDPACANPTAGQRLFIQWFLPPCQFKGEEVITLNLKVRFANYQEKEIVQVLKKNRGYYLFDLIDQEYCESGGIRTYLVEIKKEDCVITSWKHPLWVPLIVFE
jgi:hypothetical protein